MLKSLLPCFFSFGFKTILCLEVLFNLLKKNVRLKQWQGFEKCTVHTCHIPQYLVGNRVNFFLFFLCTLLYMCGYQFNSRPPRQKKKKSSCHAFYRCGKKYFLNLNIRCYCNIRDLLNVNFCTASWPVFIMSFAISGTCQYILNQIR